MKGDRFSRTRDNVIGEALCSMGRAIGRTGAPREKAPKSGCLGTKSAYFITISSSSGSLTGVWAGFSRYQYATVV